MSTEQEQLAQRGNRKTRTGVVVSDAMDKTIVVQVRDAAAHPTYGKIVRRDKRLKAHDENNEAGKGDLVRIAETRPLSKTKRWRVVEIVEKAK
ncbi:MAG TPA: 30S ribosomal protein S17 [Candidatus Paceibacterota bacterium]|nr:30S ribosomal protein S17 [Candidatus Paceibacterota bacterium]